jgi:hypothetical protein
VTFVNRAIEFLTADMSRVSDRYTVGTPFDRQLTGIGSGRQLTLLAPDDERSILSPTFQGRTARVSISDAAIPGIYQIFAADSLIDIFAVNPDPAETQQKYMDPDDLAGRMEQYNPVILAPQQEGLVDRVLENRRGREIWQMVLLAALALVALEMFIARSGKPGQEGSETS